MRAELTHNALAKHGAAAEDVVAEHEQQLHESDANSSLRTCIMCAVTAHPVSKLEQFEASDASRMTGRLWLRETIAQ